MTDDDFELQDAAAELRDQGLGWAEIAYELAIPVGAAQRAVVLADDRAAEKAAQEQISLF